MRSLFTQQLLPRADGSAVPGVSRSFLRGLPGAPGSRQALARSRSGFRSRGGTRSHGTFLPAPGCPRPARQEMRQGPRRVALAAPRSPRKRTGAHGLAMSLRVARAAGARGWGARCRRAAANFPLPPPGAVNVAELLRDATAAEEGPREAEARRRRRPPGQCSVLLFPGQGSQVVGMGRGLLGYPRVRELYAAARSVLGYDLLELSLHGPQEDLDRTVHCQPAVFVASLAAVEKLHHLQPSVRPGSAPALPAPPERPCQARALPRLTQILTECPLGARHCPGRWGYSPGQNREPCPSGACMFGEGR